MATNDGSIPKKTPETGVAFPRWCKRTPVYRQLYGQDPLIWAARSDSGSVRGPHLGDLYWLIDEQIARLEPYFPKSHGKPRVDDRRVLSGIVFVNRNGLRWCDAPREYGPHKTLYNRWKRWGERGSSSA